MSASNQPTSSRGPGWRGGQVRQETETIRHHWQRGSQNEPAAVLQGQRNRFHLKLGALGLLSLGGLAFLLFQLLFAPPLTPVIVITGGEYRFPAPPNAWALEDVDALMQLHECSLRITQIPTTLINRSRPDETIEALKSELVSLTKTQTSETIVVYLNMHGMVRMDEDGPTPCLMPAGASHLDSSEWISVKDILTAIEDNVPARVNKLLVLDATRIDVNLDLGVLHSDFSERLGPLLKESPIKNLAVLCSAGSGERSWASPTLSGSVFGHYLKKGLTGAADASGDMNRQVTTLELQSYLEGQVGAWVQRNRGARQHPRLLTTNGTREFNIAWVTELTPSGSHGAGEPAVGVGAADLDSLWAVRDQLRDHSLRGASAGGLRFNPMAWRHYEKQLAWLESASTAGREYSAEVQRLSDELQQAFAEVDGDSIPGLLATFDSKTSLPPTLQARSLASAALIGSVDTATLTEARDAYESFVSQPTVEALDRSLKQLDDLERDGKLPRLVETEFLYNLRNQSSSLPWDQPERIQRIARTRIMAEDSATPGDERAFYWFQSEVDPGDHLRRLSQDQLTDRAADRVPFERLAEQRFESVPHGAELDASQPLAVVLSALAARDSAYAEIADLAQWNSRSRFNQSGAERLQSRENNTADKVGPSIDAAHRVDLLLAQHDQVDGSLSELPSALTSLENNLAELQQAFDQRCIDLIDAETVDGATIREIDAVLQSTLADADCRRELRLVRARFEETAPTADAAKLGEDEYTPTTPRIGRHYALALLKVPADSKGGGPASLVEQGEIVRTHLRTIPDEVQRIQDELAAKPSADPRAFWSRASSLIRRAGGFWFPLPDADPIVRLREIDLQRYFVWQAERSLADFSGLPTTQKNFYEIAAADYLQSAQDILTLDAATQRRFAQLHDRLRDAAINGVSLSVQASPRATPEDDIPVAIELKTDPGFEFPAPDGVEPASQGFLNVQVRNMGGKVLASGPPQSLPLKGQSIELVLPSEAIADADPVLEAVATFRGHEFAEAFEIDLFRGQRIDFKTQSDAATKVNVFEGMRKEKSIIFVLDCSASMSAVMDIDGAARSRMQVAGDSLLSMLQQLATQPNARVGVMFFGQRAGWSTDQDKPIVVLRNPDYLKTGAEIPDELLPSQDVESVVDLGAFDLASVGVVSRRLRGVRPWGQTPLYLSVANALSQLIQDDADSDKSIVVITDGANNQFTATSSLVRPPKTGVGEVRQLLESNRIPIHIIGFGLPTDERAAAVGQFEELAQLSGGSSGAVDAAPDLLRSLQGLVGAGEFFVEDRQGTNLGRTELGRDGSAALGQALTLMTNERVSQPAIVRVNDSVMERIDVPIGRTLEFVLSPDKRRLLNRPFEADAVAETRLSKRTMSRGDGDSIFRVHRPVLQGPNVRFGFSVQDTAQLVTANYAETWIEVTPTDNAGNPIGAAYTFYDARFLDGKPVPFLQWDATNWPSEATRATVVAWLRETPATPSASLLLKEALLPPNENQGQWRSVDGLDGVRYQIKAVSDSQYLRLSVIESYTDSQLNVPFTRVDVVSSEAGRPVRIVRRFDAKQRVATHSFWFTAVDGRTLRGSDEAAIRFVKRLDVQRDAWRIDPSRPLSVGIYSDSGLLPDASVRATR